MSSTNAPTILLCADEPAAVEDLRRLLEQAGHAVACHSLNGLDAEQIASCGLIVLEGSRREPEALAFCRRLRALPAESFVPVLFVTGNNAPATRLASFEAGADTYLLRPFAPGELLAQVRAFLRIKELHRRLADRTAEVYRVNKRLQQAYQQIDEELRLARRIQLSFLPQSLPLTPRARFAVHYALCGQVGGDFYDAFRLDEEHVGFYVADAVGHGLPASLLAIYVKKGVRAKEIFGQQYRLLSPGEVLGRLNQELIEQALSEHPFITMVYVLFNHQDGTLRFARAGHPYPLFVPREGEPQFWTIEGGLLGVFETDYPVLTRQLRPGDKVLLYTDGIDAAAYEGHPPGTESLRACAGHHRQLPVEEFVPRLAQELFGPGGKADDLTLLGLEMMA